MARPPLDLQCSRRESKPEPWDEEFPCHALDSQDDSQAGGSKGTRADDPGLTMPPTELERTLADGPGRQARGLQNRLRALETQASSHASFICGASAVQEAR